ncbi:MAG: leucine-rich repeat domain-containing protein [Microcoleaceae cyanobacterium]
MVREDIIFYGLTLGLAWVLSGATSPTLAESVEPQTAAPKGFMEWCLQRESLPEVTRRTVSVILQQVGTYDCDRALKQLSSFTQLDLSTSQLTDLAPLRSLENLTVLRLINNQISDLNSLKSLKKLVVLDLSYNQIADVTPLQSLKNLKLLNLSYNSISNVEPLNALSNLNELNLNNNQITSISSLKPLGSLTYLFLRGNPIADKTCPITPKYICQFQTEETQK